MDTVKKMVGLGDDNDKCEAKVQEKLAGKLYEKLWPILSDRLCNKFEENAENMANRITDYMVHQIEEKPDLILPIVKKMLDVMNPITNNTEDERKSLVDLLEKITNKLNEIRNSEEMAKSNAPPQAAENKEKPFSETVPTTTMAPELPTSELPAPELPTSNEAKPSGLAALTTNLPGPLGASALGSASAMLGDKIPALPSVPTLPTSLPSLPSVPTLPASLPTLPTVPTLPSVPTLPASLPTLPSVPTSASGLMSMASKNLAPPQKTGGSRRMMKTYKNRLINKLYTQAPLSGKTRRRKTRRM
jgi:hypothetical protein